MYKVLVVDDEPLIARSIKQMITKTNASFTVVDMAYDGQTAFDKVCADPPDVVFTDIRMPVVDGLALAHRLQESFPEIKTVILSGYDEFAYAKAAIREQVVGYLLKPLDRQQLSDLLSHLEADLARTAHGAQTDVLEAILHHDTSGLSSTTFPGTLYLAALVCCGSYEYTLCNFSHEFNEMWKNPALENWLIQRIPYNPLWVINAYTPNEKLVLISCREEELGELYTLLRAFFDWLNAARELPITLISEVYRQPLSEAYPFFIQLQSRLRQQLVFGRSSFFLPLPDHTTAPLGPEKTFSADDEKYLRLLFRQKQFDNLNAAVRKQLDAMACVGCTQSVLEGNILHILTALSNEADLQNSVVQVEPPQNLHNQLSHIFACCSDYTALSTELQALLDELEHTKEQVDLQNTSQSRLIAQVKKYLDANYTLPITGTELASRFGLVYGYLSKLFKDYTGHSVNHYIQELRLKKAEELLRVSPPLPLREISGMTGFNDQFYFSKVFKQTHGITPADYRSAALNAEITAEKLLPPEK